MAFLTTDDLSAFADINSDKAQAMIDDAEAMAVLAAPCIAADGFAHEAAVRAILRGAILRWHEAGSGALQSQAAGPFSQSIDTRNERRGMFWPSELVQLQNLCTDATGGVYSVSLAGPDGEATDPLSLGWS